MPGDPLVSELERALPDRVHAGASVAALCTYRVGGHARAMVDVDSVADLEVLRRVVPAEVKFLVVGAGSNLLVSDQGFPGVVIRLGPAFSSTEIRRRDGGVFVTVGGAAMLPRLARQLTRRGIGGFEWAVGVPGTVGGAVRMNAGGHGSDMAAVLTRVSVFDLRTGGPEEWPVERLGLAYRHSNLSPDDVVLWAELRLTPRPVAEGEETLRRIVQWRREHQPGGQNAGSVFTNPAGDSAGRLIEAAGLKGFRIGTALVSEKHANFIQADPGVSAEDVRAVVEAVKERVRDRFGVELQTENQLVGFDRELC